jgi:saccharopine dehydrogenase (NAD+, L-lysine forming)
VGVLGPEVLDAVPFLDLLAEHGTPHGLSERAASPPPLPTLEAEAVA